MKIIKDKTHNVWITSDTHYSHKNIVEGVTEWDMSRRNSTRKFNTIAEMNQIIIDNINSVVKKDDTLIHLGDFSFGGINNIWEFRKQIICENILLVYGNHDHHIKGNKRLPNCWRRCRPPFEHVDTIDSTSDYDDNAKARDLFNWTGDYLDLTIIDNTDASGHGKSPRISMVCTHYPFASWDRLGKGTIHLHGHIHTPKEFIIPKIGKMMDVGMDGNDMKPWSFDEVMKLMNKQKIGSLLEHRFDHHTDKNTH